ncbi:transcription factor TGA2.2-like [Canna indica]|uniref:Transcription factor TGA2.2-like n=1 Tax=Canna indica TaxID=4628 RepID=A0AAQ3K9J7_9LILI|nr:transcription factor TGA2.2-like [Canna indica]
MPSFVSPSTVVKNNITEGKTTHSSRASDFGSIEQFISIHIDPAASIKQSGQYITSDPSQFGDLGKPVSSIGITTSTARVEPLALPSQNRHQSSLILLSSGQFEKWEESTMADGSPRTDTSTDGDTDDKNQRLEHGQLAAIAASDSSDRSKDKPLDQKTLRRLAQNREAARKSRLRKKAYVQQLESSRLKLTQLEQELQRARQQGIFISSSGDQSHSTGGNGALAFDVEYARWLEEQNRQINELRAAVNAHASENDLRVIVDGVLAHYDEIFRLKGIAAKADVFHILSGMWKTPAERCFLWLGGFRSSELLKLLANQLEPLTEQQLVGICNLQQSSQQAEDALSQGMEALQQSLAETLAGSLGPSGSSGNVANYMGQMAMAMGKLGTLENFLRQADNLRQQTLQQMHRILTTRQSARALLAIHDYFSRLRALSSLWLARPRE